MRFDEFVSLLSKTRKTAEGVTASCPAHEDSSPSLSVSETSDGKILVHDFGGCTPEAVVAALGLTMRDLMGGENAGPAPAPQDETKYYDGRTIEKRYPYKAADGILLYEVLRLIPKDFRQRRPDPRWPGRWIPHLKCADTERCRAMGHELIDAETVRTIYRLDELAKRPTEVAIVVEGEKDADAIAEMGVLATCNTGGAGKWREEYSLLLKGRREILIIADLDEPGRRHANDVAASLRRHGTHARVVSPPKGKDFSDFLAIAGHDAAQKWLDGEVEEAGIESAAEVAEQEREEEDAEQRRAERQAQPRFGGDNAFSIYEVVLSKVPPPEGFLAGSVFCRGDVGFIAGPDGSYKTFFALYLNGQIPFARQVGALQTRQGNSLFISQEMSFPGIADRCRKMFTVEEARAMQSSFFIDGSLPLDFFADVDKSKRILRKRIKAVKADFVIVDALIDTHTGDENSNRDMGGVLRAYRDVARDEDAAIVVIAHAGKPSEFRIGSNRLRGASAMKGISADILMFQPRLASNPPRSFIRFAKTRNGARPDPLDFGVDLGAEKDRILFSVAVGKHDEAENEEAEELGRGGARKGSKGHGDEKGGVLRFPSQVDQTIVLTCLAELAGEAGLVPVQREDLEAEVGRKTGGWGAGRFNKVIAKLAADGKVDRIRGVDGRAAYVPSGKPAGENGVNDY